MPTIGRDVEAAPGRQWYVRGFDGRGRRRWYARGLRTQKIANGLMRLLLRKTGLAGGRPRRRRRARA